MARGQKAEGARRRAYDFWIDSSRFLNLRSCLVRFNALREQPVSGSAVGAVSVRWTDTCPAAPPMRSARRTTPNEPWPDTTQCV